MKVTSTHTYAAPSDVVFTMLTDPDVLTAKYTALGHRDISITEHSVDDGAVTVRSRRSVPMDVPGFAKRFLSPMNTAEQHDHWDPPAADGSRSGTWEVTSRGVPISAGGTLRITPGKKRTTVVEVTAEISCSVPLVGGKLASLVSGNVKQTLAAEEEFNDGYIADL